MTDNDTLREQVAKAIAVNDGEDWNTLGKGGQTEYLENADAVIPVVLAVVADGIKALPIMTDPYGVKHRPAQAFQRDVLAVIERTKNGS
jgi:hypothetical protein